jgi:hypothetical protein
MRIGCSVPGYSGTAPRGRSRSRRGHGDLELGDERRGLATEALDVRDGALGCEEREARQVLDVALVEDDEPARPVPGDDCAQPVPPFAELVWVDAGGDGDGATIVGRTVRRRMPSAELLLDRRRLQSARREEHVAVEPEVGELLDEPLVGLGDGGQRGLDALLPDLAAAAAGPASSKPATYEPGGRGERPFRNDPPEPRREARTRRPCGTPGRWVGRDRGARLRRSRRGSPRRPSCSRRWRPCARALGGSGSRTSLAALPCPAQRLVVRVREHQYTVRVPRPGRSRASASHRPSRLLQLGLQLR